MKVVLLILFLATITYAQDLNDPIDCFRQKDSSFGHFLTCSASKPLPLKIQTVFVLDKDYAWSAFSYDVALFDGISKQTTSLSKCLQGSPGPGNKTAGANLTLATTCNTLPRALKQYDMVRYEVHFPNLEWLVWSVPIPGYTTYQDVERIMKEQKYQNPIIKQEENYSKMGDSPILDSFIQKLKSIKHIRNN